MTTAVAEPPAYCGVHHYLHETAGGWLVRRKLDRLSMVADRGRLDLTVVDSEGKEATVQLDLNLVDQIIEQLPVLRNWVASGQPAA